MSNTHGDSDVYLYRPVGRPDLVICENCRLLVKYADKVFFFRRDALLHIEEHIKADHVVPDYITERLKDEISEWGNEF